MHLSALKRKRLGHLNGPIALLFCFHISCICAKNPINVASKNRVQIDNIEGYMLRDVLRSFGEELNKISKEELAIDGIEEIYSKFKYTAIIQDVDKTLQKITGKLETKLNESLAVLNNTKNIVEQYSRQNTNLTSILTSCFGYMMDDLDNNSHLDISSRLTQSIISLKDESFIKETIKHIYLLANSDVASYSESNLGCDDPDQQMLWKTYMQRTTTQKRNVMLLLDHGGSLSNRQFKIVKAIAKQMISVLNKSDKIGVVAISDDWSTPYLTEQCLMPNQVPPTSYLHIMSQATDHNKYLLNKFIDSLTKGNGVTNHSLGFQQALRIIKISNVSSSDTVMLLYISRGLLSSLTEAKTVLEMISFMLDEIDNTVIINTCAVIDVTKPIIYETHFLRDIAEQNYTKYNIDTFYDADKGVMLSVNSSEKVGLAVARFYEVLGCFRWNDFDAQLSLPFWSDLTKDLTVSLTVPVGSMGDIGLIGLDLYFFNLVEDVMYYSNYQDYTYAFMITIDGIAVMHPSYPRPNLIKESITFVDIIHLEKIKNFAQMRKRLIEAAEGNSILTSNNQTLRYVWKRVANLYIICIVIRENETMPLRPHKVNWFPSSINNQLVHHRLDILPATNLCQHLNLLATLDSGSLYLSASCFHSPFSYLKSFSGSNVSATVLQNYMAYLKDNTRLLANPGLKEEVRDDVVAMSNVLEFLRVQHLSGYRAKYIVRRYVASATGVLQVFPGSYVAPGLDPSRRNWFLTANEFKHKVVLTPPYLDAGGAGFIVTVAYATSQVIVGMDVTLAYVYKLMLQKMPFCSSKNIKCFMMDDKGYLIYHPSLIDPNGHGPTEQQHIIHKESLVANDMLNYQHFVRKMLCNNYADETVQRYYKLNTSLDDVLVNAVHGEQCVKYQLGVIENSNVFIGVVNATCEVVATFCPCSTIDRLCLNCNRMEQKECECPCECPLNLDTCTHPNRTFIDNPLCSIAPEQPQPSPPLMKQIIDNDIKPCMPISCEMQLNYHSCLGVLGCEWCQLDVDGETPLANPFCTSFTACFNGVLGSVTPYGNAVQPAIAEETEATSSLFYIAGFAIILLVLLGSAFFCHRYFNSPNMERFYFASVQDNQVRMSDFNISDEFHEVDNHHQDKLLQDSKKSEPLSPYCVSTGYRRPLTAADSDHGYSTMTPHDDSEHLSFAPLEIDSLEDDCTSDAASINTCSVSSRRPMGNALEPKHRVKHFSPLTDIQVTSIPTRNCIIAPVTVHRNMEVSQ